MAESDDFDIDDDDFSGFECVDCSVNTLFIKEYYMLTDDVWLNQVNLGANDGMLCIGCVEARIGRRLEPTDFADVPLNRPGSPFMRSSRLEARF